MLSCVDRGGTFTDVVVFDGTTTTIQKVPSDVAVVGALAKGRLVMGTTVVTNALLEGRRAKTALIVTRGFADLPWIADQARPSLFDPEARWPAPLCDVVIEIGGRLNAEGREIEPLSDADRAIIDAVDWAAIESVAIVLVHSPLNPQHEQTVAGWLPPHLFCAVGHQLAPERGYLARIETTLIDAALTPILRAALVRDQVPADALAMRSDGSLCPVAALRAPDALLSGPAAGVRAVAAVAEMAGFSRAVGLDMGGTSTDVCRVEVGALPHREGEVRVAGLRVARPVLEIETIAAGGGSILSDDGLRLSVGPASAGAFPGPACYGRGGPPTLTDAALAMGWIDPQAFHPPLVESRATLPGDPLPFITLAQEAMAQAIRRIATGRGVDLADHALVAYGGAAGQYAAVVAEKVGIRTVLFHPCAAVLCAWGMALARPEEAGVVPIWRPLATGWPAVTDALHQLRAQLPAGEPHRTVELRYQGTDHAIAVPADDPAQAARAFLDAHQRRYGFLRDLPIEIVNARLRVVGAAIHTAPPITDDPWGVGDAVIPGPTVIPCATTSIVVPSGWSARRQDGLLWLVRASSHTAPSAEGASGASSYQTELWGNRFMAVATWAGETLRRLARSVNIRERLDFSCAIFDGDGRLVANAPHIPVHLGAMGETVRDLIRSVPALPPDQAWLCNDPRAGGSHLPDLTVVRAVVAGDARWFVACRAHHVDVGGLTPGSMPPHSRTLADEGLVFRHLPLLQDGRLRPDIDACLAGCRDPGTVRADLEAQLAANATAAAALVALGPPAAISAWMEHLRAAATAAVSALVLPDGEASDVLDGVPLHLRVTREQGSLHLDFTGTGGPHPGNCNAPRAVTRAAVLFALRCLLQRTIPMNEGIFDAITLTIPTPSILSPPPDAAVVGGNVETSQRIVDLILRAVGARAGSQGTMNNLTLGGAGWSFYETIGGGTGASAAGPGVSGRQVHMTNTRATDVEILEARLPIRVRRFCLRRGSGGAGVYAGGDGLIRELELCAPATAALLATRRDVGAAGLGGGDGQPGIDEVYRDGAWQPWDGQPILLQPGDRARISTPGGGGWSGMLAPCKDARRW